MIKLCLISLLQRKGRTALIALSIAIGVFSVLVISIISDNGIVMINDELDILGLRGVSISKYSNREKISLTNSDLNIIKSENYVESATPVITAQGYLKNSDVSGVLVCGIDENAKSVISVETVSGNNINDNDIENFRFVCAIDEKTTEALFKNENPIGETIDIFISGKPTSFTVIGTVKASSSILQTSVGDLLPSIIYVPFTTLQKINGDNKINQIAVDFTDDYSNEDCIERIKATFGVPSESYTLKVEDLNKQRESLNGLFNIITTVLRLIGSVSLIVSGLGIMTIMLVTVKEKTKEIGIKKSIGATKIKILFEFLFESAVISFIGCFAGVIITIITALVAENFLAIQIIINPTTVLIVILSALMCGVVFGVYPAMKAASLSPIVALREE